VAGGRKGSIVQKPTLQSALLVAGVALLVHSAVPVGGGPVDVEYVHRAEPATGGTLAYGIEYDESDVLAAENLSERGRHVVARAVADSPCVVERAAATAPEFRYTSDNVALGQGLYAVRYERETYSVVTQQRSEGFNLARLVAGVVVSAARLLGGALLVASLVIGGVRRYRDANDGGDPP
jgi:hypothetical protein